MAKHFCREKAQNARKTRDASGGTWLAATILVVGAALRIGHYASGEALWYDEIAIARNLVEKSLSELITAPLDYAKWPRPAFLSLRKQRLRCSETMSMRCAFSPCLFSGGKACCA